MSAKVAHPSGGTLSCGILLACCNLTSLEQFAVAGTYER